MRKTLMGLAALTMAGLLLAADRPGVVRLKDGAVYEGSIEEKTESVTVNVRGIITDIPRDRVASIEYGDFAQRWQAQYEKLDAKDSKGRVDLARRAFDERRYDLAEKALRDAQAIDPNNAEAAELLRLTISQRRLEKTRPQTPAGEQTGTRPTPNQGSSDLPEGYKTLDADQINRIKQKEVVAGDDKLRFVFKNDVQKRYHGSDSRLTISYAEFLRQPMEQRARMILENGAPDMAADVQIVNDPQALLSFKRDAQPLVLRGCATSECHGGMNDASKAFALISPAADQASTYTNFYQLATWQKEAPQPDGAMMAGSKLPMIDRLRPEQSLLLQYALPAEAAEYKHPPVQGYKGLFPRGRDDNRYRQLGQFIDSLKKIEPEYGIDFKLQRKGETVTPPTTQSVGEAVEGVGRDLEEAGDMLRRVVE